MYSTEYATLVKNNMPYASIDQQVPAQLLHSHPPCLELFKVFGFVVYAVTPVNRRLNKMLPGSTAHVFLGYSTEGGYGSAISYNPTSKGTSTAHVGDLVFNENCTCTQHLRSVRPHTPLEEQLPHFEKHDSGTYLCETDLSEDELELDEETINEEA